MGSTHRADVRHFYEEFGWREDEDGLYRDQTHAVDARAVVGPYFERANDRIRDQLPRAGVVFMDAGSGPVPHPEQLEFSADFAARLCLDLTQAALQQAREKLGAGGWYVQADLARLPLRDGAIDAFCAAHVLYHLPAEDQAEAVQELHRVLSPGASGVIVYATPRSPLTSLADPRSRLAEVPWARAAVRWLRGRPAAPVGDASDGPPPLPVHANPLRWWRRFEPGTVDVRTWAAADVAVTRRLVPDNRIGATMLRVLAAAEDRWPHVVAWLGRYPLVVVRK